MKKREIINFWKKIWLQVNDINEIISKTTGLTKNQLFLNNEIEEKYIQEIKQKYLDLKNWVPLEYIINKAVFYWIDFFVDNKVLIPRNDTEILVEQVLVYLKEKRNQKFILIDIWTWSWIIPISITLNSLNIDTYYAIDISKKALEVSKINIDKYNLKNLIIPLKWDLLNPLISIINKIKHRKIIITANLPYIKNGDFENMADSTIKYEPDLALYWWEETWFELYEKLINQILEINYFIKITLFIEIWFDQYNYSKKFLKSKNLKFNSFKDNNLIYRCIKIEF